MYMYPFDSVSLENSDQYNGSCMILIMLSIGVEHHGYVRNLNRVFFFFLGFFGGVGYFLARGCSYA